MKIFNLTLGLLIGVSLAMIFQPTAAEQQPEILTVVEKEIVNEIKYIRVNQTEPVVMEATAYTANYESTGKRPGDKDYGIAATGIKAKRGICAVDDSVIPMGSSLFVEGYGYCLAADKGSAIKGYSVDVFIPDLKEAQKFGREQRKVWILNDFEKENVDEERP